MGLIPRYHLFLQHKLCHTLYPDQYQDCAVTGLPVPVYFVGNQLSVNGYRFLPITDDRLPITTNFFGNLSG